VERQVPGEATARVLRPSGAAKGVLVEHLELMFRRRLWVRDALGRDVHTLNLADHVVDDLLNSLRRARVGAAALPMPLLLAAGQVDRSALLRLPDEARRLALQQVGDLSLVPLLVLPAITERVSVARSMVQPGGVGVALDLGPHDAELRMDAVIPKSMPDR
jgi:hypothetical protein